MVYVRLFLFLFFATENEKREKRNPTVLHRITHFSLFFLTGFVVLDLKGKKYREKHANLQRSHFSCGLAEEA